MKKSLRDAAAKRAEEDGIPFDEWLNIAVANALGIKYEYRKESKSPRSTIDRGRQREMIRLRHEQKLTLKEIGEIYGLSRERVRQIIGNTGFGYANRIKKDLVSDSPELTNRELSDILDVSYGTITKWRDGARHAIDGHSNKIGFDYEEVVANILISKGFSVELQPYGHPFDILVNGKCKVDVKVTFVSRNCPSLSGLINPSWSFCPNMGGKEIDFFVFCIAPTNDNFVIPAKALPKFHRKNRDGAVRFVWPTARPEIGRYQKYHERYDLIESWLGMSSTY